MDPASLERPSKDQLRTHVERVAVSRDIFDNQNGLARVQAYIEETLKNLGYTLERQPFVLRHRLLENVIARKNLQAGLPRLMIGAHFDAVPGTPGADDNASGVAVLLEIARILAQDRAVQNTEFVAFNAEEYGMAGSKVLAESYKNKGILLSGMLSLEMVGFTDKTPGSQKIPFFLKPFYPDRGDFLALVGDSSSRALLRKARNAFREASGSQALPVQTLTLPFKGWPVPASRLSDHSAFWDQGYPALLVTDTSFFRNPHYHQISDTPDRLDLEFMAQTASGIAQLAQTLSLVRRP